MYIHRSPPCSIHYLNRIECLHEVVIILVGRYTVRTQIFAHCSIGIYLTGSQNYFRDETKPQKRSLEHLDLHLEPYGFSLVQLQFLLKQIRFYGKQGLSNYYDDLILAPLSTGHQKMFISESFVHFTKSFDLIDQLTL